ncbi:MAG TPA: proton-conducting transporter membrane subunit [Anaerolineaceae bacterium]|nr:proton-conducting transporter membrane subunit [Anaerolineaceae bacterium]
MNLPFIFIVIPLLVSAASLIIRKRGILYRSLLSLCTFLFGLGAFIMAALSSDASTALSINEEFLILGRSLHISYTDLPLIGLIYFITTLWIVTTICFESNTFFPALSVSYTGFLVASISIDPFLYSTLIFFLANGIFLIALSKGEYRAIAGRMRFLLFQLLSVFLILLAGWILAGGEIAPVEEDQLFISSVLLGCGVALWLGAFPFHTWIPLLVEEVFFLPFGFMMTLMPISGILMLLRFVDNFAWLREYSAFYPAVLYLGVVMILLGGIGSFFQKSLKRVLSFVFIAGIGMLLSSVGFVPYASTDLVGSWLIPIAVGFWSISLAYVELVGSQSGSNIEDLKGKFIEKPLHAILLISGLFTVSGLPLFSGFAPNILMLHISVGINRVIQFCILGGEFFLCMTAIRLMLRLFIFSPPDKMRIPDKIKIDRILVGLIILWNIFQGIFPSLIFEPIFKALSKIFPLI